MLSQAEPAPEIQIRLACPADAPGIIAVVNAAFAVETFFEGTRTDEARMADMMSTGEFLVAEEAGQIVASIYVEASGERGYCGMLAVAPARQGSSLFRRMAKAVEDHCRERDCTHLDISVLNLRSELPPVYRRMGFVEISREEFHPSQPLKPGVEVHSIVMRKQL